MLNTTAPRGKFDVAWNATLDVHKSTLTPSPLASVAVPFLNLSVANVGQEHPIRNLWNSYPKLHDQVQYFHVSWGAANAVIASLLTEHGDVCNKSSPAASEMIAKFLLLGSVEGEGLALQFAVVVLTALVTVAP